VSSYEDVGFFAGINMRAYEIGDQAGLQSLRLVERPIPQPGPGEVVVRVRAACLNHRDLLVLNARYGARRPESRIPVSDGVGEIHSLGNGVSNFEIGERVICPHFVRWIGGAFNLAYFGHDLGISHDGWLAEAILVPAAALIKVPSTLSDAQAAPLPAAGLTAWNALVEIGKIKAGDLVLTLGTGGVSILALQFAKMHGARVAITSSSDEKLARARALGADITINYRTHQDWSTALLAETKGVGADIILETGGYSTLSQSIAAAATNARIALIGALAGPPEAGIANFSTIIGKNLTLCGITEGSRAMLSDLVRAVDQNGLRPVIDKEFSFDQAADAYAYLHSSDAFGKVMIRF
jgi:NADPH:quinone reductase-like Zn-dependent oxidoreductase